MISETSFEKMLEQYLPLGLKGTNIEQTNRYGNSTLLEYERSKFGSLASSLEGRGTFNKKINCCKGRDGVSKKTYNSKNEAQAQAEYICDKEGVDLKVYYCKYGAWHLTKD